VRVWMEGPGRLSICRAHAADVEHVPLDGGVSAGHAMAATLVRSDSFFPVTADELLEIRDAFPHGQYSLTMEPQAIPAEGVSRISRVDRGERSGL